MYTHIYIYIYIHIYILGQGLSQSTLGIPTNQAVPGTHLLALASKWSWFAGQHVSYPKYWIWSYNVKKTQTNSGNRDMVLASKTWTLPTTSGTRSGKRGDASQKWYGLKGPSTRVWSLGFCWAGLEAMGPHVRRRVPHAAQGVLEEVYGSVISIKNGLWRE